MYSLKLLTNFVAHLTFQISKLKLFLCDKHKLDQKQGAWLDVKGIKHWLVVAIEGTLHKRQTCLEGKEYLVKYKGCYHKEECGKNMFTSTTC
jgi:hypothetical protein